SAFADPIEVALTVSSHGGRPQGPKDPKNPASPSTAAPAPTRSPTVSSTASVANTAITPRILSQDTFQRADQLSWGAASDGHLWGGDAPNKNVFSVAGKTGPIANGRGGVN